MKTNTVTMGIADGLDARVIPLCVQAAGRFHQTEVRLSCGERHFNAKSMLGLMALGLAYGDEVTIITNGPEEDAAMDAMTAFLTEDR